MFRFLKKNIFLDKLWLDLQLLHDLNKTSKFDFRLLDDAGLLISKNFDNEFISEIKKNTDEILNEGELATKTSSKIVEDNDDMYWLILSDSESYDLLSSCYTLVNALHANESLRSVIGLVLKFLPSTHQKNADGIYLIYRMDLKSFYPFSPTSNSLGAQNKEKEISFSKLLNNNKFQIERDRKNWLGIWGIPF